MAKMVNLVFECPLGKKAYDDTVYQNMSKSIYFSNLSGTSNSNIVNS